MLKNKTVAVVVPAYNEENQIGKVIETMPDFVDKIVIVNDLSKDKTDAAIKKFYGKYKSALIIKEKKQSQSNNPYNKADQIVLKMLEKEAALYTKSEIVYSDLKDKIVHIKHLVNGGVGASIATGYKWCRDNDIFCTAVMAGDAQMDPDELESICMPVIEEGLDYVKGNRLIHKSANYMIPKVRFIGNSILSMLTKIASGYWHISDTQTGYTAISLEALNSICLYDIYPRYGMPNDILIKLNMAYCTLKEVPIKPVYNVGEQSKMKIYKVIPSVSWLLLKGFFKRIFIKYFLRDFNPIFLFYFISFLTGILSIPVLISITENLLSNNEVTTGTYLEFILLAIFSIQFLGQGMNLDIQDNQRLYKYR